MKRPWPPYGLNNKTRTRARPTIANERTEGATSANGPERGMRNDEERRRAKEGRTTKSIKQVPTYPPWLAFPRAENAEPVPWIQYQEAAAPPFFSPFSALLLPFLTLIRRLSSSSSSRLVFESLFLGLSFLLVISSSRSGFRLGWFVRGYARQSMCPVHGALHRGHEAGSRRKKRIAVSVAPPMLFLLLHNVPFRFEDERSLTSISHRFPDVSRCLFDVVLLEFCPFSSCKRFRKRSRKLSLSNVEKRRAASENGDAKSSKKSSGGRAPVAFVRHTRTDYSCVEFFADFWQAVYGGCSRG